MDFASTLRPNEVVIWSAQIQRQREAEGATLTPIDSETTMTRKKKKTHKVKADSDPCADPGEFRVSDKRAEQLLRQKWGL